MRKYARPNKWVSGNVTLLFLYSESYAVAVVPFTGAWIETRYRRRAVGRQDVVPFTGAWIETSNFPEWVLFVSVVPFTGAWIETLVFTFIEVYL